MIYTQTENILSELTPVMMKKLNISLIKKPSYWNAALLLQSPGENNSRKTFSIVKLTWEERKEYYEVALSAARRSAGSSIKMK